MEDLTPRQLKILKIIIEEHIQTGEAVGSETLDKKYNLGISPATIRNEMLQLEQKGFLVKPHTSGGRLPTIAALKFYIKRLMEEKQLSITDEVALKEKIWDSKDELEHLLNQATSALAQKTRSLALAATSEGDLFHAGYANILEIPEFYDIDVTKTVLSLIEDFPSVHRLFNQVTDENPVHVLFGEELGTDLLAPCALVFTNFEGENIKGSLGVFGPCRLDFPQVIPTVRYFGDLLEKVFKDWR